MTSNSAAGATAAEAAVAGVIRRTSGGWRVNNGEELPELLNAMVLADLLAAEEQPRGSAPAPPRGSGGDGDEDEQARLRLTVAQLEHALHTRVVTEQAIGVLSERHGMTPRKAFELLRSASRSRGRKVAEMAREVVASSTNPLTALPGELAAEGAAAQAAPRRSG
ncbi:ANTAR domain-containing protein [Streptomonospora sp. DSM 45055]|uniref:ANTAR domain-containing protein n=1 Tax=Streptomonospora wellingtoniae TaxID=3075544 RepID=A0ABU2KQQ4_9ACTN|nr:ANTAR domain-containing protein [Streptomonospora sp. DSM 45055]MDT0301507.1 ANTAR domain-containing protein [Streptomonospora sp. DSM 45055]